MFDRSSADADRSDTVPWGTLYDMVPGRELADLIERVDPALLHGPQLLELVVAQQRLVALAQARLLRTVHELSHAVRGAHDRPPRRRRTKNGDAGSELAFALTLSDYAADRTIACASLAIETAPDLIDAVEAGEIDLPKLTMLHHELSDVEETGNVRTLVAALRPEFRYCTVAQLRGKLRVLLLMLEPDAVRKRHAKAAERRRVEHIEYPNGTAALAAYYLPKDQAAAAWSHIDAIAQASKSAGDERQRTIDQLRADIFADLLAGVDPASAGAAQPAARKGVINLHIGLTTLACLNDHPGLIPGFGPVLADIARQAAAHLAETSRWRFTLENDDGQAVASGRLRYRPTVDQRAFIADRDQTCRAPGCQRPAIRCDIDHVRAWADGGPTTIDNLMLLCRRHHRLKHKYGYQLRRTFFGTEWVTPLDGCYAVLPVNAGRPDDTAIYLDLRLRHQHRRLNLRR